MWPVRVDRGAFGLVLLGLSLTMGLLPAAEPADSDVKHGDLNRGGVDRNDADRRFAEASLRVAEAELKQAQQANRQNPGAVSATEVERLEANLARVRAQLELAKLPAARPEKGAAWPIRGTTEERIERALGETTTLEFRETNLADVFDFIEDKHKIPIVLDVKSLDDAGIASDTPITKSLKGVSLRSALNLLLRELDMTYLIEDEVLLITTQEEASQRLDTTIYDVRDLLETNRQDRGLVEMHPSSDYDYDSLIEAITTAVMPTTWGDVGGPGSISPLQGTLVILQTQEGHRKIEQFLSTLRKVRAARKQSGEEPAHSRQSALEAADPNALVLRIYKILVPMLPVASPVVAAGNASPGPTANRAIAPTFGGGGTAKAANQIRVPDPEYIEAVADAVRSVIETESWQEKGGAGVVRALPANESGEAALAVLQTPGVHQQVAQFLSQLAEVSPARQTGGGFF